MDVHDRRRLAAATVFTIAALPALWLLDRDDTSAPASPAVAAVGVMSPTGGPPEPDDTYEPEIPAFLDNTVPVQAPAVIDIVVPAGDSATEKTGRATFQRYIDATVDRPCTTQLAPTGATITVTNLDNGQSTICTNTITVAIPAGADMTMDTEVYVDIADLTDAPVPVRLSW